MKKKTDAKCDGSMLTVGFHSANPPLIWRFDLERNHSFTLALQGEEGDWELGITTPKGDFYPVVHFVAREDAEEAFAKVEKILARRKGPVVVIFKALACVVAVAILITAGVVAFGNYVSHRSVSTPIVAGKSEEQAPPNAFQEGIPLPADDVVKPPS